MPNQRQYPAARLLRQREPYHWQRKWHKPGEYPRPPQPAIQPNQVVPLSGWSGSTRDYWANVFKNYNQRRLGGK